MNRLSNLFAIVALTTGFAFAPAAVAQTQHAPKAADLAQLSSGQIKKVDKDTGKLTIQHGPLANLNMPSMTMIFTAQDTAMLGQVKVGDKVRFRAEQINGVFTVTKLEAAQ
ncbi:copper-binding protein [Massilia horti]|uniref:RND transporter n=1 Tax=Massilia horti TaxID=2562153 RepID=A0A4Y9T5M5_9BURK|nr:copper-binding protein [Massilia horti]TFW36156.1 RND transporter [Massilia horti]